MYIGSLTLFCIFLDDNFLDFLHKVAGYEQVLPSDALYALLTEREISVIKQSKTGGSDIKRIFFEKFARSRGPRRIKPIKPAGIRIDILEFSFNFFLILNCFEKASEL
jgi:hypothetical protein